MSIGISVVKELRRTNLSQLRKNTRSKVDKRSGRKRPRSNNAESELLISCVHFLLSFFLLNQGNTLQIHRLEAG